MDSSFGVQRLFHTLVKENKAMVQATDILMVAGKLTSDLDEMREGWASYYESLATPETKPEWNEYLFFQLRMRDILWCNNNKVKGIAMTTRSATNLIHHVEACHKSSLDNLKKHVGKRSTSRCVPPNGPWTAMWLN